jgi:hypothetical protein
VFSCCELLWFEASGRGPFGNAEAAKLPPLETVTMQ